MTDLSTNSVAHRSFLARSLQVALAVAVLGTICPLEMASGQEGYYDDGYSQQQVGENFFDATTKFDSNSRRPLGGLFAPDFTRTLTFFGGWNRIVDFASETGSQSNVFDDDFAVGIAYGRRHSQFMRSEFSFTYRSNEVNTDQFGPLGLPAPDSFTGQTEVYSIMKNFLFEFPGANTRVTPYVGIGIGYAYIDPEFQSGVDFRSNSNSAFAYQPMGGVSIDVSARSEFFVEYRYFRTTEIDLLRAGLPANEQGNYDAHNLFVGLRFEF